MSNTSEIERLEIVCNGGLILDRALQNIPKGSATQLQNYEPGIQGGYRRINGYSTYDSSALTGAGVVLGIAFLGTRVIGCRGANVMYSTGSGWTSITSGRTAASRYHFDRYNWSGTETLIMADSVNPAATYDSSNYVLMNGAIGAGLGTAPTAPVDVKEFNGHMFYAQGNTLTFSAPFSENNFLPGSGAGTLTASGTIRSLKVHREQLYVLSHNSIQKVTGDTIATFKFVQVTKNIGCVSGWTVQEIGGDLIFLAPDGLRTIAATEKIDDVDLGSISQHMNTELKNLDETTYTFSSMVIRNKNQYRMWYVTAGGVESEAQGIMATLRSPDSNEGADASIHWEFSQFLGIKPAYASSGFITNTEYFIHGGYTDGILYKQEIGNSFNGSVIPYIYRSPDLSIADMGLRKRIKRVILNLKYEGTNSPGVYVIYDFGAVEVAQPAVYQTTFPSDIYIYDDAGAIYGTSTYYTNAEALDRIWVQGSGFTVALKISGTGTDYPFTIRGFQLEYAQGGRR